MSETQGEPGSNAAAAAAAEPYRVCLIGASLDVGNMGVRALAISLIGLVRETQPGAKIAMVYSHHVGGPRQLEVAGRTVEVEVAHYRLSPRAKWNEHLLWILWKALLYRFVPLPPLRRWVIRTNRLLRALYEADFIGDVCAGDSFSDIYGLKRIIVSEFPCLAAILLGKPLVLLPQTYGPFKTRRARIVARFIMRRAARIYARDETSLALVQELLGSRAKDRPPQLCPDVAFSLAPAAGGEPAIEPPLDESTGAPLVGLNVSGLLYMGGYTRDNMFGLRFDYPEFVEALLARLMAETSAHVLLTPHTFGDRPENDQAACAQVWEAARERWGERVHLLTGELDQSQVKAVIGRCDFFLGSRMHSCIAGLSQGVPSVGLAYSRKFAGVFATAGVSEMVLDATRLSLEEIVEECLKRFTERERIARVLAERIPAVKDQLYGCFRESLLKAGRETVR